MDAVSVSVCSDLTSLPLVVFVGGSVDDCVAVGDWEIVDGFVVVGGCELIDGCVVTGGRELEDGLVDG